MSLYSSMQRIALDWIEARRVAHTARLVSELPAELRKDIGWPGDQSSPRFSTAVR